MTENSENQEIELDEDIIDILERYPDDFFDTIYPSPRAKSLCMYDSYNDTFTIPAPKGPVIKRFGSNHPDIYHPMEMFYLISKNHVEVFRQKPNGALKTMDFIESAGLALSLSPSNGHYNVYHELIKLGYRVKICQSETYRYIELLHVKQAVIETTISRIQNNPKYSNNKPLDQCDEYRDIMPFVETPLIYVTSFSTYDDVFNNTKRVFAKTSVGSVDAALPEIKENYDVVYEVNYPSNRPSRRNPVAPDFIVLCYRTVEDECPPWSDIETICERYKRKKIIIALINGYGLPQYIHLDTKRTPIPNPQKFMTVKCKIQY